MAYANPEQFLTLSFKKYKKYFWVFKICKSEKTVIYRLIIFSVERSFVPEGFHEGKNLNEFYH